MIRVRLRQRSQKAESTVALINVVFLMLIFFLIAGTLAPRMISAGAPAEPHSPA